MILSILELMKLIYWYNNIIVYINKSMKYSCVVYHNNNVFQVDKNNITKW